MVRASGTTSFWILVNPNSREQLRSFHGGDLLGRYGPDAAALHGRDAAVAGPLKQAATGPRADPQPIIPRNRPGERRRLR